MARPNVLFVFSDQHRWCDLGCYGNPEVQTPHLDDLASQGLRFTHCIANAPLCVPSRGCLLTGLLPLRHRAIANDLPLSSQVRSVAHVLAAAGYHTGYIGKWHLAGVPRDAPIPPGPARYGFQTWKAYNCHHDYLHAYYYDEQNRRVAVPGYGPEAETELAVAFVREARRPWALWLSWGPPHDPYQAVPPVYRERYRRALTLRPNVPEEAWPTRTRRWGRADILAAYQGYYAHITALDEQLGRLLAALEETGQADSTVLVYTSDHGDMLGSQGMANKQLPYDEAIRVPLLVRWPGQIPVGTCEGLIGLVDLPVTLLGLLGLPPPNTPSDGQDLHRLWRDPGQAGLPGCYIFDLVPCHQAAARGGTAWRGLRTPRYTFARTLEGDWLLLDNAEDPYQRINRLDDPAYREVRQGLRARVDGYATRYDALLPWEELIGRYGFREAWNRSQAYFGLPLLP